GGPVRPGARNGRDRAAGAVEGVEAGDGAGDEGTGIHRAARHHPGGNLPLSPAQPGRIAADYRFWRPEAGTLWGKGAGGPEGARHFALSAARASMFVLRKQQYT